LDNSVTAQKDGDRDSISLGNVNPRHQLLLTESVATSTWRSPPTAVADVERFPVPQGWRRHGVRSSFSRWSNGWKRNWSSRSAPACCGAWTEPRSHFCKGLPEREIWGESRFAFSQPSPSPLMRIFGISNPDCPRPPTITVASSRLQTDCVLLQLPVMPLISPWPLRRLQCTRSLSG
jgi:hypothetical protein